MKQPRTIGMVNVQRYTTHLCINPTLLLLLLLLLLPFHHYANPLQPRHQAD
jgi:hypothetical protein